MPGIHPIVPPAPFADAGPPPLPAPVATPPAQARAGHVGGLVACLAGVGAVSWGAAECYVRGLPWGACVLGAVDFGLALGAVAFALPILGEGVDLLNRMLAHLLGLFWTERHHATAVKGAEGYFAKFYGRPVPEVDVPINVMGEPLGAYQARRAQARATRVDTGAAYSAPPPPSALQDVEGEATPVEPVNFWEALEDRLVGWLRRPPAPQALPSPTGRLPDPYDRACRYVVERLWARHSAAYEDCKADITRPAWQRACIVLREAGVLEYVDPANVRAGQRFGPRWRDARVRYLTKEDLHRAVGAAVRGYVVA